MNNNDFAGALLGYIDAAVPVIYVESFEDDRITMFVENIAKKRRRDLVEWSSRGRKAGTGKAVTAQSLQDFLELCLGDISEFNRSIILIKDIQYYLDQQLWYWISGEVC